MSGITGSIVLPIVSPPVNPPVGGRKPHKTSKKVKPPPVLDSMTVWATVRDASTITDASGVPIAATDGVSFDRLYVRPECSLAGSYLEIQDTSSQFLQTYNTNVNGYPALTLPIQHSMRLMDAGGSAQRGGITSDVFTMFVVASYDNANAFRPVLTTAHSTNVKYAALFYDTRTQKREVLCYTTSSSTFVAADMLAQDTGLGPRLLAMQSEGAGSNIISWKDGVKQNTTAVGGGFIMYDAATTQIGFGTGPSSGTAGTIYVSEAIVYNALLSDADVGLVSDYLTAVYGL